MYQIGKKEKLEMKKCPKVYQLNNVHSIDDWRQLETWNSFKKSVLRYMSNCNTL